MEFQPCQFYYLSVCRSANPLAHNADLEAQESAPSAGHSLGLYGSNGDGGRDDGSLDLEDFRADWIVASRLYSHRVNGR